MTTALFDMRPLTRWQRIVARLLPWYDPKEQAERIAKTDRLVKQTSRIQSIKIAYRDDYAERVQERRRVPR